MSERKPYERKPPEYADQFDGLRGYLERADSCQCSTPIPGSTYMGRVRCVNCGRLRTPETSGG